jgi:phosphohistidine swiveling domain-containing protein
MAAARMSAVFPLDAITSAQRHLVGGKAYSLACLARDGLDVPDALCVSVSAYRDFLRASGLLGKISLELARKSLEDMRWEEVYDSSLRIRQHFALTSLPGALASRLTAALKERFGDRAVAVRSSALAEDSAERSFAGLHESLLAVRGPAAILEAVKTVWSSLWSEGALLYRRQLGLDPEHSAMGVIVQAFVPGEVSGVAFGRSPLNDAEMVIEAVPGLNQGLVDGQVEPDRWIIDRDSGSVRFTGAAGRTRALRADGQGVGLRPLAGERPGKALLDAVRLDRVIRLVKRCEELCTLPQDVEWTLSENRLILLQSRAITTRGAREGGGAVPWQQSCNRLDELRRRVETELIPDMRVRAGELAAVNFSRLDDRALAAEITERTRVLEHWRRVYAEDFIPLAHGMRLFGRVYNERLKPRDPFSFLELLRPQSLESLKRNRLLAELAQLVRTEPSVRAAARRGDLDAVTHPTFRKLLAKLADQAGSMNLAAGPGPSDRNLLAPLLLEMADHQVNRRTARLHRREGEQRFLAAFPAAEQNAASRLLELGRASYRLRDDDNIHLGRVEGELRRAAAEGRRRLAAREPGGRAAAKLRSSLAGIPAATLPGRSERPLEHARQLVGQPAGPGLVTAAARVILKPRELFDFRKGEILVCDALDPNMTFVIPLAAAIVERRGGMLIHGAIIAREYGLPCVTGIPGATGRIRNGQRLTVDGYLGIVVIHDDPKNGS